MINKEKEKKYAHLWHTQIPRSQYSPTFPMLRQFAMQTEESIIPRKDKRSQVTRRCLLTPSSVMSFSFNSMFSMSFNKFSDAASENLILLNIIDLLASSDI